MAEIMMRWLPRHCLLEALYDSVGLLAHDERADVSVGHIGFVHRSNSRSLLTTSSRSFIVRIGLFELRERAQVGRTGRKMMQSPSRTVFFSVQIRKSTNPEWLRV